MIQLTNVTDGRDPDPNPDLQDIFSPNPDPDIGIFLCQSRYILPRITKGLDDIEDILKDAKTLIYCQWDGRGDLYKQ